MYVIRKFDLITQADSLHVRIDGFQPGCFNKRCEALIVGVVSPNYYTNHNERFSKMY